MKEYNCKLKTKFWWIIPYIIGIGSNTMNGNKVKQYSIFITPFIEISFNWLGTRYGCEKNN